MSVKRYEMKTTYRGHESWDSLEEDEEGSYVDYEDYVSLEQKLTDMAVQLANAESKCRELAGVVAENSTLKSALNFAEPWLPTCDDELLHRIELTKQTPATDAFLAEVRAQGVDAAIEHLSKKFEGTGHIGVPVIALEWLAQELRKGAAL